MNARELSDERRAAGDKASEDRDTLEEELRALKDTIVDGLIIIDENKKVVSFNPAAAKIFGYDATEVIGRNVKMLMPEPYRGEHDAYVDNYRRSGDAKIIGIGREVAGRRKDGSEFPMYLSVGEMKTGSRRKFVGIVHDLTELKAKQEQIDANARQFQELLEAAPDAIWIAEASKIVYANPAAATLLGFADTAELVGRDNMDFVHPDDRGEVLRRRQVMSGGGTIRPTLLRRVRTDGDIVETETSAINFTWQGRYANLMIARDVTDRNKAETQLRQAQKMEALGRLTGGVAHDFNNLLAVLMMDVDELSGIHEGHGETEGLLQEAREAIQSGSELASRLLTFARREEANAKRVNVREWVSECASLLRRTLGAHIELNIIEETDVWPILVDARQLENAILNLTINARDAMPKGGKITIETRNTVLDEEYTRSIEGVNAGEYVHISVTDTGTGIPKEIQDKVFEPFFTTKDLGAGTGLGLSMVYGFAKQIGGHAALYSEAGHGTTISLYLPRAPSEVASTRTEDEASPSEPAGSEKILLVEDFQQLRTRGARTLRELRYTVLEAANSEEALAVLERDSEIDLLFTDIVMPGGMNGFELAERVREIRPDIKVLFASGYADGAEFELGIVSVDAFRLQKPYSRQDLARTIRRVLDGD